MSWLDEVRAALDATTRPCPFFFRDDDAGWADDRLGAVLDVFDRRGVGVDVAVIPAALNPTLVTCLRARAAGAGVRLHQHGFAHVNHEASGRKHEFGPARDLGAQLADIVAGQRLLRDAFGDLVDPVFTPPWNRCTSDTGGALLAAGLSVISQDATAPRHNRPGLTEVPISVDWFAHRKGVRLTRAELGGRMAAGVRAGGPVGVMLHHEVTDDVELAELDRLLRLVIAHPNAQPATILELVR